MKLKDAGYFVAALLVLVVPQIALPGPQSYQGSADAGSGITSSGLVSIFLLIISAGALIAGIIYFFKRSPGAKSFEAQPGRQTPAHEAEPRHTAAFSDHALGSVFISYRRDDSADITGRIHERLIQRFAHGVVFKDVDSIPLGIDFRQHIENALSQCRVLIAVIGDRWIESGAAMGKRRIDDSRDQLRLELEVALGRNIPVIPVLVRKAAMPSEEELPSSLRALAYRNGIQVRPDPDFNTDMERLIKGIAPHLKS